MHIIVLYLFRIANVLLVIGISLPIFGTPVIEDLGPKMQAKNAIGINATVTMMMVITTSKTTDRHRKLTVAHCEFEDERCPK